MFTFELTKEESMRIIHYLDGLTEFFEKESAADAQAICGQLAMKMREQMADQKGAKSHSTATTLYDRGEW